MEAEKKKRLEDAGWVSGDAADFFNLSDEERAELDRRIKQAEKELKKPN